MRVRIVQIDTLARRVKRLTLGPTTGHCLAAFAAGSHVQIALPQWARAKPTPFSLTGSAQDTHRYQIVVFRRTNAGLVTRWLHDAARAGEIVDISAPRCGLPLHPHAAHHCLVAGGSGISAFFSHLHFLHRRGHGYELHYAMKDRDAEIWCDDLLVRQGKRFTQYVSTEGQRVDFRRILSVQPPGAHVYVCGPSRLIQSAVDAARVGDFPSHAIHWDTYGWQPRLAGNDKRVRCAAA